MEIRVIRQFFICSSSGKLWEGEFTNVSSGIVEIFSSNIREEASVLAKRIPTKKSSSISEEGVDPLAHIDISERRNSTRACSRSELTNLTMQLEHVRQQHKLGNENKNGIEMKQDTFVEKIVDISDQWRQIKVYGKVMK